MEGHVLDQMIVGLVTMASYLIFAIKLCGLTFQSDNILFLIQCITKMMIVFIKEYRVFFLLFI